MAYKVKAGIFKGLKVFSRIFAVKEHELEIGYPTDVKHVAHIGWDSAAGGASPSWINDIMASSDFSSLGNFAASTTGTSWVSQDLDRQQRVGAVVAENTGREDDDDSATCPADVPRPPRKLGRKKEPKDGSPSATESSSSSTDEVASPAPHVDAAAAAAANATQ